MYHTHTMLLSIHSKDIAYPHIWCLRSYPIHALVVHTHSAFMHNTTIYMFHLCHTLPWYIRDTIISIDKWAVQVTTVALKALYCSWAVLEFLTWFSVIVSVWVSFHLWFIPLIARHVIHQFASCSSRLKTLQDCCTVVCWCVLALLFLVILIPPKLTADCRSFFAQANYLQTEHAL